MCLQQVLCMLVMETGLIVPSYVCPCLCVFYVSKCEWCVASKEQVKKLCCQIAICSFHKWEKNIHDSKILLLLNVINIVVLTVIMWHLTIWCSLRWNSYHRLYSLCQIFTGTFYVPFVQNLEEQRIAISPLKLHVIDMQCAVCCSKCWNVAYCQCVMVTVMQPCKFLSAVVFCRSH